jgi:enamine deaminase RidA (YjgF/YER057c/UK114 family)
LRSRNRGLSPIFAVMTAIQVAGFVEEGAKLEIEVTAVIPE